MGDLLDTKRTKEEFEKFMRVSNSEKNAGDVDLAESANEVIREMDEEFRLARENSPENSKN